MKLKKLMHKKLQNFIFTITLISLLGSSFPVYAVQTDSLDTLPLITSFGEISSAASSLTFDDKPELSSVTEKLPQNLTVYLDSSASSSDIPVTWSCTSDYVNTDYDTYEFIPVWDSSLYSLSPSLNAETDIPHISVIINALKASVYLTDLENAQNGLNTLVQDKAVLALIYLCDSYDIKQKPFANASSVLTVSSGQSVQITGVAQDSIKNIWYKISTIVAGTTYSGYVEREHLAYSDEELLAWEYQYVSSYAPKARTFGIQNFSSGVSTASAEISEFPESYQAALTALKNKYPNWTFVRMDTGINWSTAIASQNNRDSNPHKIRSLIHSSVNAAWKDGSYDSNWSYPTDGILAYYMDPRNFLNESYIFQFEFLSYSETYHTETAIQGILDSTFMSGLIPGSSQTYAETFLSIARDLNVSPFHLASRVRQEQGDGKSALISGTYPGYEELYNYFNIGASGQGDAEVIKNGLTKARSEGWTSRYLSLKGGSNIISRNYIQIGQNTLYLQKFNVTKNDTYNHQYMQNIAAPSSEALSVKQAYNTAGALNKPFVFRIPVYSSMPSTPCKQPTAIKEVTLDKTSLTLALGAASTLTAFVDGKTASSGLIFASSNTSVATVDANGTVTGVYPGTATITATVSGGSTASCTVTVLKADPSYTVPVLSSVTYSPGQKLSSISLTSGWAWDNPDTVPSVVNSGYPATFTPVDTGKYNIIKKTIPLTVQKGIPAYTVPTGLQTVAGNTLASIKLPAGFTWEAPATILEEEGSFPYKASYNPDTANYNTVNNISITVTVAAKQATCTTHTFGEWEHVSEATCTKTGTDTRSCHVCGYKETAIVPALGHLYTSVITKEATEEATGIRTYTCSRCGDSYTEVIDKLPSTHKHSYTSKITKEATCTEKGTKTYTCSCGDSYSEDIAALGHSYKAKVTKEATETETGIRTYTCDRCGDSYTEIIPKVSPSHSHSYTSKITKEATCTDKGIKTYTCSCGNTYTEDIPALGHDMADGKCKRCGYTDTKTETPSSGSGNTGSSTNTPSENNNSPADSSGSKTNSSSGQSQASGQNSSSAKTDNAVKGNTADNPTIDMRKNTVLYEETLAAIRGEDVDVILNMGSSITWTINGRNIVADEANGVDMSVKVGAGNIPSKLLAAGKGESGNNTVIELSLAHNGTFDFKPVLTINTAKDNAGRIANLFYYNPDTEELEFIDAAEVSETGDISFIFSHASDYAVIISDTSMEALAVIGGAVINEGAPDDNTESIDGTDNSSDTAPLTSGSINPRAVVIVIIILLICTAVGLTIFFLLRRGEDSEDDENEYEDASEYFAKKKPSESVKAVTKPLSFISASAKDEEYDEDGEEDFIDDYHEPETPVKKTGKVISMKRLETQEKGMRLNKEDHENDEFDGFE